MPAFCPIGERASLAFSRSRLVGSGEGYPCHHSLIGRSHKNRPQLSALREEERESQGQVWDVSALCAHPLIPDSHHGPKITCSVIDSGGISAPSHTSSALVWMSAENRAVLLASHRMRADSLAPLLDLQ